MCSCSRKPYVYGSSALDARLVTSGRETLSLKDEVASRRLRCRVASHVVWSISPTWREFVCLVSCWCQYQANCTADATRDFGIRLHGSVLCISTA